MSFKNMKISTKIYAGFGALLALLLLVSGFSGMGLMTGETAISEYRTSAQESTRVARIETNLLNARVSLRDYMATGAAEHRDSVLASSVDTKTHIEGALQVVTDPEQREALTQMQERAEAYVAGFERLSILQDDRDARVERLEASAAEIQKALADFQTFAAQRQNVDGLIAVSNALDQFGRTRAFFQNYLQDNEEASKNRVLAQTEELSGTTNQMVSAALDGQTRTLAQAASDRVDVYRASFDEFLNVVAQRNAIYDAEVVARGEQMTENVNALKVALNTQQREIGEQATADMDASIMVALTVSIIAIIVGLIMAIIISRAVSRPLTMMANVVQEVADERDFRRRIDYAQNDEIGATSNKFNDMLVKLQEALSSLMDNTRQVASASSQASAAVGQVSDGAQSQLNSLRQISTALTQTNQAIDEVANNTDEAREQTRSAVALIDDGKTKMEALVTLMSTISENSDKINQITEVIARIANQTNMLSLNAAIEAARAGEHGKGFAVVAEEVRKLAEDVANSVQEISTIVEEADKEANRGVSVTGEVSESMEQIGETFKNIEKMVEGVASAMNEQRATSTEITTNVESLTKISEDNASASEEITATMIDLSKLATSAREQVEQFKVA